MMFDDWMLRQIVYQEIQDHAAEEDSHPQRDGERTTQPPSFLNETASVDTEVLTGDARQTPEK